MCFKYYSTAEKEEMDNTDELERDVGVSATNLRVLGRIPHLSPVSQESVAQFFPA